MRMSWRQLLNSERPRASTSLGDHRLQFERDFDRSVFSTPVKRLQDKAQVFPLEAHDAIRTRLTHSLEVSTVARGLATKIFGRLRASEQFSGEFGAEDGRAIEAISATCGLLHDLGNPPFGHAGEDAIRYWFRHHLGDKTLRTLVESEQQAQDFLNFEGNAQSLRLVSRLQILADFSGLNLTFGTLSALIKYTVPSQEANPDAADKAHQKPGYFASETELVKEIQTRTGTGPARNPIVFIVEAADDSVYLAADVEDGVKKGVISWRELQERLQGSNDPSVTSALLGTNRILAAGSDTIPDGLEDDVYASAFRTAAIGVLLDGAAETFIDNYEAIMAGTWTQSLVTASSSAPLSKILRDIGKSKIYKTHSTLKLELMGRKVVSDLMTVFWEGAEAMPVDGSLPTKDFAGKAAALISSNYKRVFQYYSTSDKSVPLSYRRLQLVTDQVCGMTDSFAKTLHSELFNGS